ncbi:T9SS type A sorting domain-containing protein [Flammeovirga sp. SubArs3]|uniref:T9SS type A sorting domain-containing protein n=1 Tax=Flammeovirga sp. SubArs3 TaxID=2995316 RepID=UPI00248D3849|nr:T9SS type A sorting domain-containing protein [Flammeovirga sp. SubArs3]
MKNLITHTILIACLFFCHTTNALTYYSTGSGTFRSADMWSLTTSGESKLTIDFDTDQSAHTFVIQSGNSIPFPSFDTSIGNLIVQGNLNSAPTAGVTFNVADLIVTSGGFVYLNGSKSINFNVDNVFINDGSFFFLNNTSIVFNQANSTSYFFNNSSFFNIAAAVISSSTILNYNSADNGTLVLRADETISEFYSQTMVIETGKNILTVNGDMGTGITITTGSDATPANNGSIVFSTNATGTFSMTNPTTDKINNLTINTSDTVTLGTGAIVAGTLYLTDGFLKATRTLSIEENATIDGQVVSSSISSAESGGSASSHIICSGSGNVRKAYAANAAANFYLMPVGDGTSIHEAGVLKDALFKDDGFTVSAAYFDDAYSDTDIETSFANTNPEVSLSTREYYDVSVSSTGSLSTNPFKVLIPFDAGSGVTENKISTSSIYMMHYNGATWESYGVATHLDLGDSEDNVGYVYANAESFSPFTFGGDNSNHDLPVELISLSAKTHDNGLTLEWETATEINNDYFEIEASSDARNYHVLGKVSGQGNSNVSHQYSFEVNQEDANAYYIYRLKQVDFDGTYSYSDIVQVKAVDHQGLSVNIYPNPVRDQLNLEFNHFNTLDQVIEAKVYNKHGQLIETLDLDHLESINVNQYTSGIYILHLKTKSGKNQHHRFSVL